MPPPGPAYDRGVLRHLARLPRAAVVAFAALYVVAALAYPGGTRADPDRVGFSVLHNYWCDVLDAVTYGGRPNPAAPIALGATLLLALGLSALWWTLPALTPRARIRGGLVRAAGVLSAVVTPLIATKHHDLVINVAALAGAFAFVVSATAIGRTSGRIVATLSGGALLAAIVNYVCWATGFALDALPMIQKVAFAAFLTWVFVLGGRVRARLMVSSQHEGVGA
jgi:hypothetical protein